MYKITRDVIEILEKIKSETAIDMHGYIARAKALLLGERRGIIDRAVELRSGTGGCYTLPQVSSEDISVAMLELIEEDRNPIGIARCGRFRAKGRNRHKDMGNGITHLLQTSNDMLFVSCGDDGILAEVCHKKASAATLVKLEII